MRKLHWLLPPIRKEQRRKSKSSTLIHRFFFNSTPKRVSLESKKCQVMESKGISEFKKKFKSFAIKSKKWKGFSYFVASLVCL